MASSARLPSGRFPFQVDFHSWPCLHPRGSRPSSGLDSPAVAEAPVFVSRRPPLRFLAPSARPVPVVRVPVARSLRPLSGSCAVGHLVAGFHARAVPPAPFLTTLTTCSVRGPVGSFAHSRPWGSGSLYSTRASPCEGWVSSAAASRSGLAPAGRRCPPWQARSAVDVPSVASARRSVTSLVSEDPCAMPVRLRLPLREFDEGCVRCCSAAPTSR